jgi:mitofilin
MGKIGIVSNANTFWHKSSLRKKDAIFVEVTFVIINPRNEMENEMRSQLRRQAAAHSDHIQDVLEVQQKELGRLHAR